MTRQQFDELTAKGVVVAGKIIEKSAKKKHFFGDITPEFVLL